MKQLSYSSMAALLAHYRALRDAASRGNSRGALSADERETLAALQRMINTLAPEERAAITDTANGEQERESGEDLRRRQRAETKLRRIFLAQGILSG